MLGGYGTMHRILKELYFRTANSSSVALMRPYAWWIWYNAQKLKELSFRSANSSSVA